MLVIVWLGFSSTINIQVLSIITLLFHTSRVSKQTACCVYTARLRDGWSTYDRNKQLLCRKVSLPWQKQTHLTFLSLPEERCLINTFPDNLLHLSLSVSLSLPSTRAIMALNSTRWTSQWSNLQAANWLLSSGEWPSSVEVAPLDGCNRPSVCSSIRNAGPHIWLSVKLPLWVIKTATDTNQNKSSCKDHLFYTRWYLSLNWRDIWAMHETDVQ